MATDVSICSTALQLLGDKEISAFTGSERATKCGAIYPIIKEYVLRKHPWNCATKRVTLSTPDVTAPAFGFGNRFQLPTDFLRMLEVGDQNYKPDYMLEDGFILTDEASINIRYIYKAAESKFDSLLTYAMVCAMKAALAYPVLESTSEKQVALQELKEALREAKTVDGQEDEPETLGDFPLIDARYR